MSKVITHPAILIAVLCVLLIATALYNAYTILDPDFGYRLTTGNMIVKGIFPQTDPYSYTMPLFPYVEHAWMIAALWALIYASTGMIGLSVFQTIVFAATLFVLYVHAKRFTKKGHIDVFQISILFLSGSLLLLMFAIRAQVVSWLFFAILFLCLSSTNAWKKYRFFIPAIFLVWANTHGSFVTGLILLVTATITRWVEEKHISNRDVVVIFSSLFLTLINPYGTGVWREAITTMTDANLRYTIDEWMPPLNALTVGHTVFAGISLVFISYAWRRFTWPLKILLFLTAIAGATSSRNMPIAILFTTPLVIQGIGYFKNTLSTIPSGQMKYHAVSLWTSLLIFIVVVRLCFVSIENGKALREEVAYPQQAISFLTQHEPEGNIFAPFEWGGYFIQHYPQKKVFIDGRMASWKWGSETPAFALYQGIRDGTMKYDEVFQTYGIDTVVWHTTHEQNNRTNPFETLRKDGWKELYKDDVATIYQKPHEEARSVMSGRRVNGLTGTPFSYTSRWTWMPVAQPVRPISPRTVSRVTV